MLRVISLAKPVFQTRPVRPQRPPLAHYTLLREERNAPKGLANAHEKEQPQEHGGTFSGVSPGAQWGSSRC